MSCNRSSETEKAADSIIQSSIDQHGGLDRFEHSLIEFDFREYHYRRRKDGGSFLYTRTYADSLGREVFEATNNDSTWRVVEGQYQPLTDSTRFAIYEAINSVIYFALLPYKLTDEAVNSRYVSSAVVGDEPYHKVEVTFDQEGGGADYQDRFLYWFHKESAYLDYLAYTYEVNGGGERFREAYNRRTINGMVFQDYRNYRADSSALPNRAIARFDQLLAEGRITEVSTIALKNVRVELLE